MVFESLPEQTKKEIARLFNTTDFSVEKIASQLNVSVRTVYNYSDYGYEIEDHVQPSTSEITVSSKKKRWLCKTHGCDFITDKKNVLCPKCQRGPFFSNFVEIGTPEHERFIKETEGRENEESCDWTKDYYFCKDCNHSSNKEFKICPECHSRAVEFAPDGMELRDPSKYKDPDPQDHEESGNENETNTKAVEEQQQEFQWICPKCGHEWDGSPDQCPKCGALLQE
jgi:Zn finger protein HypA/HybF involved in hydrogenase expression